MLLGNFTSKLDLTKGRTALPVKFRKALGKKVIISMGHEGTLMLVSDSAWQKVTADIVNKPFISQPAREIDRFLLGNAYELELDDQGRFIIPQSLRKYASLGIDLVFVGMGNRIELWDKTRWQEQLKFLKKNINEISKKIAEVSNNE